MNQLLAQCFGEFSGTFLLILLGNGVTSSNLLRKTKSENSGWLTIIIGWGLAVALATYAVSFYAPGFFNPAIVLAFIVNGKVTMATGLLYVLSEFTGAILASVLLWLYFYPHWAETRDAELILACFSTIPAIRHRWTNFLSEFLSTGLLAGFSFLLAFYKFAPQVTPLITGLLIMTLSFSLGSTTGLALNPARDIGPRLAHFILPIKNKGKSDWAYAWIPLFGPILGGVTGALIFKVFTTFILVK